MDSKEKSIQEIQIIEQTLQNISFQRQSFQLELSEIAEALSNLETSSGDVFKVVGQLMIKADKKAVHEELLSKQKFIELRISSLEKEEGSLSKKVISLREELIKQKK